MGIQERAARWHSARFPQCAAEDIVLKSMAELGEVADAVLAGGRDAAHPERAGAVLAESADVIITLLALCGRFGHGNVILAVEAKLRDLETPGRHPCSLPEVRA
jgi:NTP pyrophosphatase (non-canonical NTP hydrolase)